MSERVTVSIHDGVADVRLNRPEKLNALDPAMFLGLTRAGRTLAADRSVRAVVLSGEGGAFCAGLDFLSFAALAGSGAPSAGDAPRFDPLTREADAIANGAQLAAWVWREMPVPVIAAIHGVCFGGGLQIALAADVRIVAPDARLSVMEIKWGLVPDMSGTQTLRHLVRLDVAKELAFTGRIVPGREAVELGLATRACDEQLVAAQALAREIATKSPDAIRATKRLLEQTRELDERQGLALEESLQRSVIGGANQLEAVAANLEKRAPRFRDPA